MHSLAPLFSSFALIMMPDNIPLLLDRLAVNAWPAPEQQSLDGWLLRSSGGVTRRASSVFTAAPIPRESDWLRRIEQFYRERGLPARFQVSDASPASLDPLLETAGYHIEVPSSICIASAKKIAANASIPSTLSLQESNSIDDDWLRVFMELEGFPQDRKDAYRSIYSAIKPRTLFLRAVVDGETVGVGMAVTEWGWTGLFSIATSPAHRKQGIGTAIVGGLARWSLLSNAPDLYLQVIASNENALRLYARLGFTYLYDYHYRTKDVLV